MSESGDGTGSGPDLSKPDTGGSSAGGAGPRPSGLRNPEAAVRGVGAAALATQGVALLLAIVPLRVVGASGNLDTVLLVVLAVASLGLAGLLRHPWAWWAGAAVPLVLIGYGFVVHLALGVVGVVLGLVWLYVLRVRATVLGRRGR